MSSAPSASNWPDDLVASRLVYAHSLAAMATVLLAVAFGIIIKRSRAGIGPDDVILGNGLLEITGSKVEQIVTLLI